jgi:putative addiction module CopG family antidote
MGEVYSDGVMGIQRQPWGEIYARRLAKVGCRSSLKLEGDAMATQSMSLTSEFEEFATELVKSGRYANGEEVLRAAMTALRREECDDAAKEVLLIEAIEEGEASGIAEGDVFARIRERAGLPQRVHV